MSAPMINTGHVLSAYSALMFPDNNKAPTTRRMVPIENNTVASSIALYGTLGGGLWNCKSIYPSSCALNKSGSIFLEKVKVDKVTAVVLDCGNQQK